MGQARSFLTIGWSFFLGSAGWVVVEGQSHLFTQKGALFTILMLLRWLRGSGPALAGNVGTGGAFALSREGD